MSKYPKIGIRPTLDGRRNGVRESIEASTTELAASVAEFLEKNLRYPDGAPVKCVIADQNIGGAHEAALCREKFKNENVGVSITVSLSWCYGTETLDLDPYMPKAILGFNGTERPGAVYLAAALAGHNQKGCPAFSIYGKDVLDAGTTELPCDVKEKLLRFARAGLAAAIMKDSSYLAIGGVSMGIAGSMVDDAFFQDYLGMRCEYVDMVEIQRRIEKGIFDKTEYEKALEWVKAGCKEGLDNNTVKVTPEQKQKEWEYCVKMAIIARDLMIGSPRLAQMGFIEESNGHNAIAAGFQGQRQWTDYLPNGDFMEAVLCSSFDWNGIREPFVLATENDSLNGACMLFGKLLTNTAAIFCDVRTYWSPEAVKRVTSQSVESGFIHLINSGAAALDGTGEQTKDGRPALKPFWEITQEEAGKCLAATKWSAANKDYFRGGGFSSTFLTKGGIPFTMVRLNIVKGLGPVLSIAEGESITLPGDAHDILNNRTDPTWPTTWFAPRITGKGAFSDVYSVMANWGANHCVLAYGHVGADFITLASILRIPVAMHNVCESDIYRPSAWTQFGTADLESADYRACAAFGPVY
ncbi:MAG: L-fucose isomerase [Oscillospiraceae bacterium]|nr:L-fucose isomerase [Oscillospiraceae bacterium]